MFGGYRWLAGNSAVCKGVESRRLNDQYWGNEMKWILDQMHCEQDSNDSGGAKPLSSEGTPAGRGPFDKGPPPTPQWPNVFVQKFISVTVHRQICHPMYSLHLMGQILILWKVKWLWSWYPKPERMDKQHPLWIPVRYHFQIHQKR